MDPEKQKRNEGRAKLFAFLKTMEATRGFVVDWWGIAEITICVGLKPTEPINSERRTLRYRAAHFSSQLRGRRVFIFDTLTSGEEKLIRAAIEGMARELGISIEKSELSNPSMIAYRVRP